MITELEDNVVQIQNSSEFNIQELEDKVANLTSEQENQRRLSSSLMKSEASMEVQGKLKDNIVKFGDHLYTLNNAVQQLEAKMDQQLPPFGKIEEIEKFMQSHNHNLLERIERLEKPTALNSSSDL